MNNNNLNFDGGAYVRHPQFGPGIYIRPLVPGRAGPTALVVFGTQERRVLVADLSEGWD